MTGTKYLFPKIFATIAAGHAAFVEYNNRFFKAPEEFDQRSADDLLMDTLKTGDVLAFNRRWYYYHLPTALMITLHKAVYGKDMVDHVGVIVQDELGHPFVYERTPFGGLKLRPYDQRILHSKARNVTLMPYSPLLKLTRVQRNQTRVKVTEELANSSWKDSELVRFVACTYNNVMGNSTGYACMNAEFLLNTLDKVGFTPTGESLRKVDTLTIDEFMEERVQMQASVYAYDERQVEEYSRAVQPVKQPPASVAGPSMGRKRMRFSEFILSAAAVSAPFLVPVKEKRVNLNYSMHVSVRTK